MMSVSSEILVAVFGKGVLAVVALVAEVQQSIS